MVSPQSDEPEIGKLFMKVGMVAIGLFVAGTAIKYTCSWLATEEKKAEPTLTVNGSEEKQSPKNNPPLLNLESEIKAAGLNEIKIVDGKLDCKAFLQLLSLIANLAKTATKDMLRETIAERRALDKEDESYEAKYSELVQKVVIKVDAEATAIIP